MNMSYYVCPHCQREIQTGARCACGKIFEPGDWPKEAYTTNGLIARLFLDPLGTDRKPFPVAGNSVLVGRDPGVGGCRLDSPRISAKNLRIFQNNGEWFADKPNHANGHVVIDGHEVQSGEKCILHSGTNIDLAGAFRLVVRIRYDLPQPLPITKGVREGKVPFGLDIGRGECVIGALNTEAHVVVHGSAPRHALLYRHDGDWWICCLAPTDGTFVNGLRIRNQRLVYGDEIAVAGVKFFFDGETLSGRVAKQGIALEISHVSANNKGKAILDDVSCHVAAGEFVGIVGPSGCGKSSLIQRIMGLAKLSDGEIRANGETRGDTFFDYAAYLPQDVEKTLHAQLSIRQEMEIHAMIRARKGEPPNEMHAEQILRLVGLSDKQDDSTGKLSGGEKRRLGIALMLLREPRLLLLDEPTAGLDPASETLVMEHLRRIANQGRTILCATHIMGNIRLFDKLLVLAHGRVAYFGTPSETLRHFQIRCLQDLYPLLDEFEGKWEPPPCVHTNFVLDARPKPDVFCQFTGYLKRTVLMFCDRHNLAVCAGQPLFIAIVVRLMCAGYGQSGATKDPKDAAIFCVAGMLWIGANNAVRELAKERVPVRCLERLEKVSGAAYLGAKTLWLAMLGAIQALIFSLVLFWLPLGNGKAPLQALPELIPWRWEHVAILFLVAFTGSVIGLGISAFAKKEGIAVALLPIVLFPMLFLISATILDKSKVDTPSEVTVFVEKVMPCSQPHLLMDNVALERPVKHLGPFAASTIAWVIVSLVWVWFWQHKNEKDWDGR